MFQRENLRLTFFWRQPLRSRVDPTDCVVIEDAPAGVAAAKNGGMKAIGIARLHDEAMLSAAGADLVVSSLDELAIDPLLAGMPASRCS